MSDPPSRVTSAARTGAAAAASAAATAAAPAAVDPFRAMGRDNYPPLDDAFLNRSSGEHSSQASQASSLDLSIGARAALDEHLRHVARYGIDGIDGAGEDDDDDEALHSSSSSSSSHPAGVRGTRPVPLPLHRQHALRRDALDDRWERLLDDHSVAGTPNSSFFLPAGGAADGSSTVLRHPPPSSSGSGAVPAIGDADDAGTRDEAIEVWTDLSVDYFNSSRVHLLRTPEKLHSRRRDGAAVTTRRHRNDLSASFCTDGSSSLLNDETDDVDDDDPNDDDYGPPLFPPTSPIVAAAANADASFSSSPRTILGASLDVSRISSADGSGGGSEAEGGATSHHHHHHQSGLPPRVPVGTSDERRSGAAVASPSPFPRLLLPPTPPRPPKSPSGGGAGVSAGAGHGGSRRGSDTAIDKENTQNNAEIPFPASSSDLRSPDAALARWPPSEVEVSHDRSSATCSDVSTLRDHSTSSSAAADAPPPSSSSSRASSATAPSCASVVEPLFGPDDRRRYRTVVPARVFLPAGVGGTDGSCFLFPEPHDSFAASAASCPPHRRLRRTTSGRSSGACTAPA